MLRRHDPHPGARGAPTLPLAGGGIRPCRVARAAQKKTSGLALYLPYLWLVAFFLVPFLIVLKISFAQTAIAMPPYVPVLDLASGWQGLTRFAHGLTLDGYRLIASDPLYLASFVKSLAVADARPPRSCSRSASRSPTASPGARAAGSRCW